MQFSKQRKLILLLVGGATLIGTNVASAFPSLATPITTYCSNNGYELLPEYQADTCDAACHSNPEGQAAANSGNYDYFCPPPAPTPEPTPIPTPEPLPTPVPMPACIDADNDGYFAEGANCGTEVDFNDNDPTAYPGAAELCNDGVDNDGNGLVDANDPNAVGCSGGCTDGDNDGFSIEGGSCGPVDCNDNNSAVNPGAAEICNDGTDNNCNGTIDTADKNAIGCSAGCSDQDADGFSADGGNCGPVDCNDSDPTVNPGALEVCSDGVDNNCNSQIDDADHVCQDGDAGDQNWWRQGDGDCPIDQGTPGDVDPGSPGDIDPGTDDDGSDEFIHPFGWTNPTEQHKDFVDDNGVDDCVSCHSIDPADRGSPTSCYNCHGQEWDDPGASDGGDNEENDTSDDEKDDDSDEDEEHKDSDRHSSKDRRDRDDD